MASIFFGIIFLVIGILVILSALNVFKEKEVDYSQYPTTTGMVLGTEDYYGDRWVVRFTDAYGNDVLAMDDKIARQYFHPERYHTPERKQMERIYYWPYPNCRFRINGKPVTCEFHFCDETLYGDTEKRNRKNKAIGIGFGILFLVFALLMILKGLGI